VNFQILSRATLALLLYFLNTLAWGFVPGYAIERGFLHDGAHQASMDALEHASFTPFTGDLHLGVQQGATWIRLQIRRTDPMSNRAAADADNPFVLRVGPHALDHIDLYENVDGRWRVSSAGDRRERTVSRCPDDVYCFTLQNFAVEPFTLYLKVQTKGIRVIETELTLEDRLVMSVAPRVARTSTALALSAGLLLVGVLFLLLHRTRLLLFYCSYQASVLLLIYADSGMLAQHLPNVAPEFLDDLGALLQVVRVTALLVLGWAVVARGRPPSIYLLLLRSQFVACGFAAFMVAGAYAHYGLILNYLVLASHPLVQMYGATRSTDINPALKKIILTAYAYYLLIVVLSYVIEFDVVHEGFLGDLLQTLFDWRLNGAALGVFVVAIITNEQASHKIVALQEVQALRMEALQAQAQREILKERNTLIDVLTHELKTPLGTMRFALASLARDQSPNADVSQRVKHIAASVMRMNTIIDHVAESMELENSSPPLQWEKIAAGVFVLGLIQDRSSFERFQLQIAEDVTFYADRNLLVRILENLLSNAEKYSAPGNILISVRNIGRRAPHANQISDGDFASPMIVLEICNPVDAEKTPDAERLFERYYRHPNVIGLPGMGIGLNIVRAAAEKLGATVHYRFDDGWAVFEVRFSA